MKRRLKRILGISVAAGLATLSAQAQSAASFANLPLWFEAGSSSEFIAHAAESQFVITPSGTEFTLAKTGGKSALGRLHLVGADAFAEITGENSFTGKINYLIGNNPAQWRANIPTFGKIHVRDVYPGIDVVYYGNRQKLEYDFNLAAGANPSVIILRFEGAQKVSVNPQGALVIQFDGGSIVQHPPLAYQMADHQRHKITARYRMLDTHTAGFAVGSYDHSRPLVIDPILAYSTYYGGNYGDVATGIAVNPSDGSIYVAGQTFSTQFTNSIPFSTADAYTTNYQGGMRAGDAFVARFDASGTNLIYATYLGGSGDDSAYAIAVDSSGNAYVAGSTLSTNFPVRHPIPTGGKIAGTLDQNIGFYPTDAFVTELDPSGTNLVYSTYLGGNSSESANGIALDLAGDAFVTGFTYSTNFPVTPATAYQPDLMCSNTFYINANSFVTEVAAGGSNLLYSTFLGGTNYDIAKAIAWNNNRVFVAGYTYSTNFPNTNALPGFDHLNGSTNQNNYNFGSDAFVSAFSVAGTNFNLLYSTYLGGSNYDGATGIAAAADGTAYVAGYTTSTNFPYTTTNVAGLTTAYVLTNTTGVIYATNGFLTQIKWDGSHPSIGYSTMFGGYGLDIANGVALDPQGNAYVVGSASSTNFPATTNNISGYLSATNRSQINKGYSDAFIIAFNTNASALLYSAYLGGQDQDFGNAIAVDPLGNAYLAGQTLSTDFPTVSARQTYRNGTNDMFIAKISQTLQPPAPVLAISPPTAGSNSIRLTWQMFPANYGLESASDLGGGNWLAVPASPVYSNGWYQVTLPTTNNLEFFRLHQN